MPAPVTLTTPRLVLRPWLDTDILPYVAINADPRVMEHFTETLTPDQSHASAERIRRHFEEQGWGLWAVALREDGKFIGFTGLQAPSFEAHFTPCVEIGWRLSSQHWGHGYAPEAASVALSFAFDHLGLTEVVSMTATQNLRSRRVMEKLAMTYDPADDFENPLVPIGHRIRRHVLYRKRTSQRNEAYLVRRSLSPLGQ